MKLTIIIPAFNEETSISEVIRAIKKNGYENIIVVDDGSSDLTLQTAKKAGAVTYKHAINCGVGAALNTGFSAPESKNADIIVTLDGDGQHHAHDIEKIIAPILANEAQVVIGSRFLNKTQNKSIPKIRHFYNKIANFISFLLSGIWLTDSQSGFRAFSSHALKKIKIDTAGYDFLTDMNREIGIKKLRVKEVPISVTYSEYSLKKGQNFSTGIETFAKLIIKSLLR